MSDQHPYSVRDIIDRYESEEDEFLRELEDMRDQLNEDGASEKIPPDPAPILSVLCNLVDEIGSLRTENKRLKTRLIPPPRAKNVVQRMSAMFETRNGGILPRLRRNNTSVNDSSRQVVQTGARDRLSTPPRKSMTESTVSSGPPLVQPELSDSEIDDNQYLRKSRDTTRRCDSNMRTQDNTLSGYTSPSSASSSRDPSERMTASRSSFFDLFGFRRRSPNIFDKKRRKRVSGHDSESSGNYANMEYDRLAKKPPRPSSYYVDSDSDSRRFRQRKATSFLAVNSAYKRESTYSADFQHEKDAFNAEIEELKMRNTRLVEQLREKSQQQSKLQCQLHKVEMQVDILNRRCALSEALDRLTLDERFERAATSAAKRVEDRLRVFENQMQAAKAEACTTAQLSNNFSNQERHAHQSCMETLEHVQREHMKLLNTRFNEVNKDDASLRRKLESQPTYEALYAFTHAVVRRLAEARLSLVEKNLEASRLQMDLVATQSSLLVTHAQMERHRISLSMRGRKSRRPSSYHGSELLDRNIRQDLNFYLPFKLQGSRVENSRRAADKTIKVCENNIEQEFLKLFSYSMNEPTTSPTIKPVSRIEFMMREMNGNVAKARRTNGSAVESQKNQKNRRPISLVEPDEQRRFQKNESQRRSVKYQKTNSIDYNGDPSYNIPQRTPIASVHDVSAFVRSPHGTPILQRKISMQRQPPSYDTIAETATRRKLDRGFSMDDNNAAVAEPRRATNTRLQRSQPVSRMRQPAIHIKNRTLESTREREVSLIPTYRNKTLDSTESKIPMPRTEKKGWLEKLKGITKG